MKKKTVLLIITLDTKGPEALFLRSVLVSRGVNVLVMDTGIFPPASGEGDISRLKVAGAGGKSIKQLIEAKNKGEAIRTMIDGATVLARSLYDEGLIHGVLSIGGAQGTLIGTTAMRGLPVGVPKVMLSTMASGNRPFGDYVGDADITIMHSVVDFFGLNPILKQILTNAASAVAGMVRAPAVRPTTKAQVAVTIYGTTTPAGLSIVALLEKAGYSVVAFHPNGVGGMAMERMIREGLFDGVIDLTTHELIDEIAGGSHAGGPERLLAASDMAIPQIVIPGSTDYIVTGRISELRRSFLNRTTMMHNPEMTFVQPSDREMATLGLTMARRLNRSQGNTAILVPLKGFSYPNHEGRAFYNPKGVQAFIKTLKEKLKPSVPLKLLPYHINDEAFAAAVVREFLALAGKHYKKTTSANIQKGDTYVLQRKDY